MNASILPAPHTFTVRAHDHFFQLLCPFFRIDHSPIYTFYVTSFLHPFSSPFTFIPFTSVQIINDFFTTSQNYLLSSSIYYSCVSYSISIFNYGAFDLTDDFRSENIKSANHRPLFPSKSKYCSLIG